MSAGKGLDLASQLWKEELVITNADTWFLHTEGEIKTQEQKTMSNLLTNSLPGNKIVPSLVLFTHFQNIEIKFNSFQLLAHLK